MHFGLTSIELHRRTLRVRVVSPCHFFEETGQLGEVLLPVHEFAACVPSAWDYSCLQLHLVWIICVDSDHACAVLFSLGRELEGAVELATLDGGKLRLEKVEGGLRPFSFHVGFDA